VTGAPVARSPHVKHARKAREATSAALAAMHGERSTAAEREKESRTLRAAIDADKEK
jgi:hypothetical protein